MIAQMAESEDENRSADDRETDYERLLALDAVRYYMEGGDEHPGFLLPWEELREGPTGRRYFVDMLTGEIVWKQPKDDKVVALHRPLRWHPKRIIPGKTEEEQALYLARREAPRAAAGARLTRNYECA